MLLKVYLIFDHGFYFFHYLPNSQKHCVSRFFQDTEYLVKWSGYSKYESTWELSDNISEDCIWSVYLNKYYHTSATHRSSTVLCVGVLNLM